MPSSPSYRCLQQPAEWPESGLLLGSARTQPSHEHSSAPAVPETCTHLSTVRGRQVTQPPWPLPSAPTSAGRQQIAVCAMSILPPHSMPRRLFKLLAQARHGDLGLQGAREELTHHIPPPPVTPPHSPPHIRAGGEGPVYPHVVHCVPHYVEPLVLGDHAHPLWEVSMIISTHGKGPPTRHSGPPLPTLTPSCPRLSLKSCTAEQFG